MRNTMLLPECSYSELCWSYPDQHSSEYEPCKSSFSKRRQRGYISIKCIDTVPPSFSICTLAQVVLSKCVDNREDLSEEEY